MENIKRRAIKNSKTYNGKFTGRVPINAPTINAEDSFIIRSRKKGLNTF